jgi:histidine triad (HIT) family protein
MSKVSCIFCKFSENSSLIENQLFKATKELYVILSANPQTPGHSLVIPRNHFSQLINLPTNLSAQLFSESVMVGEQLKSLLKAKAFTIKVNNKLYQLEKNQGHISHIHFHIIPRYTEYDKLSKNPKKASPKKLAEILIKLKG